MFDKFFSKSKGYAPALVRYGVGIVFLLFGIDQIRNPESWASMFPNEIPFGLLQSQIILANGIFDLFLGILLIIGLLTRVAGLIGALHLVGVISTIGYGNTAIRDFGLMIASLSIFFFGSDRLCLDRKIFRG